VANDATYGDGFVPWVTDHAVDTSALTSSAFSTLLMLTRKMTRLSAFPMRKMKFVLIVVVPNVGGGSIWFTSIGSTSRT